MAAKLFLPGDQASCESGGGWGNIHVQTKIVYLVKPYIAYDVFTLNIHFEYSSELQKD